MSGLDDILDSLTKGEGKSGGGWTTYSAGSSAVASPGSSRTPMRTA